MNILYIKKIKKEVLFMSQEVKVQPLIHLNAVRKTFMTSAGSFEALKDIDLTINKGEFVSIVGKSGSGKSTLLNMITGIDKPTSGEIVIGGNAIQTMSETRMSKWRGSNIGLVFQFFQLIPTLSVIENVMLPMDFCSVYPAPMRKERAMNLLEQVGIKDQAYKFPGTLSGGQQQRAAIARALANDPPIVIADEPTGNLDSATSKDIFNIFGELIRSGKTLVIVTHDQDIANRSSRTVRLADGRIA
jgi:putative ABC transport system ATP-binding protein